MQSLGCELEYPDLYKPGQAIQVCNPRVPMAKWETETRKYLEAHGQLTRRTEPQRTKEIESGGLTPKLAVPCVHSTYTHTYEYDCTERGMMSLGSPVLADCWLCFH